MRSTLPSQKSTQRTFGKALPLGVVTVSSGVRHANGILTKVVNLIEKDVRVELVNCDMEVL